MTLLEQQALFAHNVARLLDYISLDPNYHVTFGEAYRTPQQAEWDAQHGSGIVHSLHCDRLAIDLCLFSKDGKYLTATEDYKKFGEYWHSLHPLNRWGGVFQSRPDGNHFEMQIDIGNRYVS